LRHHLGAEGVLPGRVIDDVLQDGVVTFMKDLPFGDAAGHVGVFGSFE
jgi:hypothetical protein